MNIPESTRLCDAIEIGSIQLNKMLTPNDVYQELSLTYHENDLNDKISDAFALAQLRSKMCPSLYPFEVTDRTIEIKSDSLDFDPYLFLLLGCSIKESKVFKTSHITRDFRKYFEDIVCWSLNNYGFKNSIISIPREDRGLPKELKAALKKLAQDSFEPAKLLEDKITPDDKDLGVDIVVANTSADEIRSGKPIYLVQCATGATNTLMSKIHENMNSFPSVWDMGFYKSTLINCVATPEDLLNLESIHWERLCNHGWVLDRLRITRLFQFGERHTPKNIDNIDGFWTELLINISTINWREDWRI